MRTCVFFFLFLLNCFHMFGQPVLSSGAASDNVTSVISARWRGFSGAGAALYLGNSNIGAGPPNRVQYSASGMYLRPGNNQVSFSYDRINNRLIGTINGNSIVYNNVSSLLLGVANLCRMNYMNILLRNTGAVTGTVLLTDINLDGNPLSDLSIAAGANVTWNIQNYDFSNGFTLTGSLVLSSGSYGGSENAKLEITLGEKTPVTSTSVSTFCAGGNATVSFGGLLPNKSYSVAYSLGTDIFNSPVFTTNGTGAGSFDLGLLAAGDIGKNFAANVFNAVGGCSWNGTIYNSSTLTENSGCFLLPVSGLDLNTFWKNDMVVLKWSTMTERNTGHFLVEKSENGATWMTVDRIEAKGNSQVKTEYRCQFKPRGYVRLFLRLRLVDKDGSFTFSDVKTLSSPRLASISISPNPVSEQLRISVPGMVKVKHISLIDPEANIVYEQTCLCTGTTVDMTKLPPGVYVVRLIMEDGEVQTKRIVRR